MRGWALLLAYQSDDWLILSRGTMELEFFPHPGLDPRDSWFSACIRVDDLDALLARLACASACRPTRMPMPRMTGMMLLPHTPRMFALVDPDGSLLRCLDNEGA